MSTRFTPICRGLARAVAALAWVAVVTAALTFAAGVRPAAAVEELPKELDGVGVTEKLGESVDFDLKFTDHTGKPVRLGDYFEEGMPVMLTLNYYTCTALCSLHLNGLTDSLRTFDWKPGDQYRIVTISINPAETPALARGKRDNYLKALEKGDDVDWSFLVGAPAQIAAIAASVGFGYRYDPESEQYAHAAVTMFLSPEGKIVRYVYGIQIPERDLKFALMEASEGKVGSTLDKILLTCFHYDATTGQYGPYAFGIMRLGAGLTLVVLGFVLAVFWRRERRKSRDERASGGPGARAKAGESPA